VSAPLVVATEPVPDGNRPKYLSPSSISTFQQCPLRYRYSRIDKIHEPSTEAQVLGSMVHHVLEELHKVPAEDRTVDRARMLMLDLWDEQWGDSALELGLGDYDRHMFRYRGWRCVLNYFNLEDPETVQLDGIECRLEQDLVGVPVLGILDRYHRDPDGKVVISDYKTGKVSKKPYDAEKRQQLMVYVDLIESTYPELTVGAAELLYLSGKGTRVRYDPTSDERDAMRVTLAATWEGVQTSCDTGQFEARKSRLCDWCYYKGSCPAWTK
jgi:putative RecB family exonuclease